MMKYILVALIIFVIASCTSSRPVTQKQSTQQTTPLSESLAQKQLNGVDFFARGNLPSSWTIEIEFGNLIRFNPLDGQAVTSTAVQPQFSAEKNVATYSSKATNGDIIVLVQDEPCTDNINGEHYNKKVVVTVNNKRYEGCGQYLFDAKLNGKWMLQKINNVLLVPADFAKGLPTITLGVQQGKLTGHDGCNSLSGSFEVLGSKIKFDPLASTKMACPGNKPGNEIAAKLSGQVVDYYFTNGQLYFYLQDDSILVFDKA